MMVEDTSLDAYIEIKPTLGSRQKAVLDAIHHIVSTFNTYPTNLEISKFMGLPINSITPRTNELDKLGKVWKSHKRTCNVSGRLAYTWRA